MTTKLCVGTKKGAFILTSDDRKEWQVSDPIMFGNNVYHFVPDPRDPDSMLIAATTGHLGPTVFRSEDGGKTWMEADTPPRFEENYDHSVKFVFWLTPGHADEAGVWYAGTSPQGLFRSEDNGANWRLMNEFMDDPLISSVIEGNMGTPIGPLLHSINIDPRDKDHIILAMSSGGSFESTDGGKSWRAFNENVRADFLPDPYPETGHCVHNMQVHPQNPDIVYQQNHCGVYRRNMKDDSEWTRIGENMPEEIGDIGFPIILHPRDESKVWVAPMDGTDVWPRTLVDGKPAMYYTDNSGQSWSRRDKGFPESDAYFTVLRQATATDQEDELGIYMGTRSGEIWASIDEGNTFNCITRYLPDVYSIEVVR